MLEVRTVELPAPVPVAVVGIQMRRCAFPVAKREVLRARIG
jgi:hypothetical protein